MDDLSNPRAGPYGNSSRVATVHELDDNFVEVPLRALGLSGGLLQAFAELVILDSIRSCRSSSSIGPSH
jgi:hypothetical protein